MPARLVGPQVDGAGAWACAGTAKSAGTMIDLGISDDDADQLDYTTMDDEESVKVTAFEEPAQHAPDIDSDSNAGEWESVDDFIERNSLGEDDEGALIELDPKTASQDDTQEYGDDGTPQSALPKPPSKPALPFSMANWAKKKPRRVSADRARCAGTPECAGTSRIRLCRHTPGRSVGGRLCAGAATGTASSFAFHPGHDASAPVGGRPRGASPARGSGSVPLVVCRRSNHRLSPAGRRVPGLGRRSKLLWQLMESPP